MKHKNLTGKSNPKHYSQSPDESNMTSENRETIVNDDTKNNHFSIMTKATTKISSLNDATNNINSLKTNELNLENNNNINYNGSNIKQQSKVILVNDSVNGETKKTHLADASDNMLGKRFKQFQPPERFESELDRVFKVCLNFKNFLFLK